MSSSPSESESEPEPEPESTTSEPVLREARFDQLTTAELYALLRLRVDVFVVEQACAYPDIDGRDDEPGTVHVWLEQHGEVLAALRVLEDPDATAIGRVVTRADQRGHGYAARLLTAALDRIADRARTGTGPRTVRIGAQTYLEHWYARFGFVRTGPDYLEDDIPHLPMELTLTG
ncbi:GNAT family N-acetyltransferase [Nocardioides campestrisoli]|uniref:GNAT family N-acetyltransferase n=1 Tax=Nocardioides campestrisoli TaxID=2736757 RepID=UPI001CD70CB6|nr:GNAT family N-acetyltransferase [Nocardioides campestrisoli]